MLSWPVHRVGKTVWALDTGDGTSCNWKQFFTLDSLFVIPSTPISPLHAAIKGVQPINHGIVCNHKAPVPLLTWMADRGFQGVPEYLLKKLHFEFGLTIPEPEAGADYECQLALSLMKELKPGIEADAVECGLRQRLQDDTEGCDDAEILNCFAASEIVEDVCGKSDKEFTKKFVADAKAAGARRDALSKKITTMMFKIRGGNGGGAKALKPGRKTAKVEKFHATAQALNPKDKRWWNSIKGDMSFVRAHAPDKGRIAQDDREGRFRLTYPGKAPRSVSWTSRGMVAASLEALRIIWGYHTLASGQEPPEELTAAWAA